MVIYTGNELLRPEMSLLKSLGYNLGRVRVLVTTRPFQTSFLIHQIKTIDKRNALDVPVYNFDI